MPTVSRPNDLYQAVGQNNRHCLVQSKRLLPFHEDITKVTPFDSTDVFPGNWAHVKLDLKHATDRELILNDIRLQFTLDFPSVSNVGQVFCTRGTDLIREFHIRINEDKVFKVDKRGELSMLWLMGNHKADGDSVASRRSFLLNEGNIPRGDAPPLYYDETTKNWFFGRTVTGTGALAVVGNGTVQNPQFPADPFVSTPNTNNDAFWTRDQLTRTGGQRHDGRPRLIFDDTTTPIFKHAFDISLNQICGSLFTRLHLRRIEFIQIDILFEPWVSQADTQNFLLFKTNPVVGGKAHPYASAKFTGLQLRQYRTTVLDGIQGFTLPDSTLLSFFLYRYSLKTFSFNFSNPNDVLEIKLNQWEIRSNITRLYWQIAPTTLGSIGSAQGSDTARTNAYVNAFPPNNFDALFGVEIWWKNEKVLDLDTTFQVYRHYVLAENKRYGLGNPFVRFYRLEPPYKNGKLPGTNGLAHPQKSGIADNLIVNYDWDNIDDSVAFPLKGSTFSTAGEPQYEAGLYMVDFHMNVLPGVPGADIIDGIVNDTSDYVIKIKRVSDRSAFVNSGTKDVNVWLEYQTLVNLAANSSQFSRASQTITKQLNMN